MNIERKNILLTMLGIAVSKFGSIIFTFALSMYILDKTGDGLSFSLNLTLGILPKVLLGPLIGNIADRSNKKLLVVGSDLISGIIMFFLIAATFRYGLKIEFIYISSFLLSISNIFLESSLNSSYPGIVKKDKLTKVHSINNVINQSINFGAPVIGGMIYSFISIELFFIINGISFIFSAISESFINFNFNGSTIGKSEKSFFRDFKEGIIYLLGKQEILTLMIFVLLINFFFGSTSIIFPYLLKTEFDLTVRNIGIINASAPIGGILGGIYVGYKDIKMSRKLFSNTIFLVGLAFMILSIVAHQSSPGLIIINFSSIIYSIVVTFIIMFVNIPIGVYFQTAVDREYLGRIGSIFTTMATAIMPIAYILYGSLLTKYPSWILLIMSGLASVIIAILARFHNNLKDLGIREKQAVA